MSDRTNLNIAESPMKYILGSIVLLILSGMGIFWLTGQSKKETNVKEDIVSAEPTKIILPTPTVFENDKEATKSASGAITPTMTINPTIAEIATTTPSPKAIEEFKSVADGFGVKYKGSRKIYEEKEPSGKRYIFYSNAGNITVHVGKTWSWVTSGRIFSETLLVGGEKSYIYEISNQKIVDVEKADNKFTIQCVHNAVTELKTECDKFLADFYFI